MLRRIAHAMTLLSLLAVAAAPLSAAAQTRTGIPVTIESTPPGAEAFLDGTTDRLGVTPVRYVRIPRGQHFVIVRMPGYREGRLDINVATRREVFRITLDATATVDIQGASPDAVGAAVRIDGQPVGNIPYRAEVQPGRHLVQVGREGFVTFSQWVDLAGGQNLTLPVTLEREAPRTGEILVAGDTSGAAIYVDGSPRGSTPMVVENVPEGQHDVEVRPNDANLQPHRQSVFVQAGQRATVSFSLQPVRQPGGSLRVLVQPTSVTAIVSVDGEALGEAPASASDLSPGEHIVEAQAEGYQPAQQPVTVEDGRQRVVSITLQPVARAPGRIVVNANVDGATVTIDGEERGAPPVVVEEAAAGAHAIIVRANGYQEFRQTCEVAPGRNCEVQARLEPLGTPVRVVANVRTAVFVVDGEVQGPIPFEGTVPIGAHLVEIRADGYRSHIEQVNLSVTSEPRVFEVTLVGENELTDEERAELAEQRARRIRESVARSAAVMPSDMTLMDASLGWPHVVEFRLGVGILDWLEGGFGVRTFGRLTEFEGRVKAGARPIRQISIGGQVRLGGGIGPSRGSTAEERDVAAMEGADPPNEHPTSTLFLSAEAMMSLHFSRAGAFSLWLGADFHGDRWDFEGDNADQLHISSDCLDAMGERDVTSLTCYTRDRQGLARLRLGGSLEIVINRRWNVWAELEGILAGRDRRIFGDIFGANNPDTNLYARGGFTYKFGSATPGRHATREDLEAPANP